MDKTAEIKNEDTLYKWEPEGEASATDEYEQEMEILRRACEEIGLSCRVEVAFGERTLLAEDIDHGYLFYMTFSRIPDPITREGGLFLTISSFVETEPDEIENGAEREAEFNLKSDVCGVHYSEDEGTLEFSMAFPADVIWESPAALLNHALTSLVMDMERF